MIQKLTGTLQPYAWGGKDFLRELLRLTPSTQVLAEYWLGMHPSAPASLDNGEKLDTYLRKRSLSIPYLLKILDIQNMLSIQVHPSKLQAEKGYEAEERKGIPLHAPQRIFKDPNHKPEMSVALSDFFLLSAFRPLRELPALLTPYPSLHPILGLAQKEGYKAVHEYLYHCADTIYKSLILPVWEQISPRYKAGKYSRFHPEFWFFRAQESYPFDRTLLFTFLLNLVSLREGQAYYHKAGILHAYLEGQCVEIMANSDNVLRAGLTHKPVHIEALMRIGNYEPMEYFLAPSQERNLYEIEFICGTQDFSLRKISLPAEVFYSSKSRDVEIFFVIEGTGFMEDLQEKNTLPIRKGQAFLLLPNTSFALCAQSPLSIFRASPALPSD